MTYRYATNDDLDTLVSWAKEFHAFGFLSGFTFSPNGTKNYLRDMIRSPHATVIMNDFGAIGGIIEDYPFCEVRFAKELFWYAHKDGLELLGAFSDWAKESGCDVELISSLTDQSARPKAIERIFHGRGYRTVERSHYKVLE